MKRKVVIVFLIASLIIAIALCMISCNKSDANNNSTNNGNNDQPSNDTVSSGDNNSSSGDNVTDGNNEPSSGDNSSSGDDNENQNPSCNHTYSDKWSMDETYHWHVSTCGHKLIKDKERHNWDSGEIIKDATCVNAGVIKYICKECNQSKTDSIPTMEHTYSTEWSKNGAYHWHETICGHHLIKDKTNHNFANTGICTECEYDTSSELNYELFSNITSNKHEYTVKNVKNHSITNIVIPAKYKGLPVTHIADSAFSGCSSLTSIEIPSGITFIGSSAFDGCTNLQYNKYDNGLYLGNQENPYVALIKSKDKDITSCKINANTKIINSYAFSGCSSLTSIEIPSSVMRIGSGAFSGCSGLTGVYIADIASWCAIYFGSNKDNPLYYAHNLYLNNTLVTELVIPSGVTSIGKWVFSYCMSLTSIEIPNSVTSIGSYAFDGCSSLISIDIPSSVMRIGSSAFSGCSGLTGVYITDIASWCATYFGSDKDNPLYYAHNLYLNNTLVTELIIPSDVKSIGEWAFSYCMSLTSIDIPSSVTSIGDYAFCGCSNLTSVTFGEKSQLESIGYGTFLGCSSLISIEIPSNITYIDNSTFDGCSSLTSIEIPVGVIYIGDSAFSGCSSLTSIEIPSSVTHIVSYAFENCISLTTVMFREKSQLESIADSAFSGCSSLTSIEIPSSVIYIGASAFKDCSSLTIYCEAESKPSGWDSSWNSSVRPVVWGYKMS